MKRGRDCGGKRARDSVGEVGERRERVGREWVGREGEGTLGKKRGEKDGGKGWGKRGGKGIGKG